MQIDALKSWPLDSKWSIEILLRHHVKKKSHVTTVIWSSSEAMDVYTCPREYIKNYLISGVIALEMNDWDCIC